MNRDAAITELEKFKSLADLAGVNRQDATPGFSQVIDSALRELDFTESDLSAAEVEDGDVRAFLALLDFYALKLLKAYLAPLVDLAVTAADGRVDKKRSQAFAMVNAMLLEAKDEVKRLGYLDSDFELVRYNTNYIEPSGAEI